MQKNDTHEGHRALDYLHNSLIGHVTNRTVLLHVIASTLRKNMQIKWTHIRVTEQWTIRTTVQSVT
jgi:hypothetical protein